MIALVNLTGPIRSWYRLSLGWQFLVAGAAVLLIGVASIELWVSKRIEYYVTRHTATNAAFYVTSFIEPLLQSLNSRDNLPEQYVDKLKAILSKSKLGDSLVSVKIWKHDGTIVYSTRTSIIGKKYPVTQKLKEAWRGKIIAKIDDLAHTESRYERNFGIPLLELYCPIRNSETGAVIAVAEFYYAASNLNRDLFNAKLESIIVIGTLSVLMLIALSGVVLGGSRTIRRQRIELKGRVEKLSELLKRNEILRSDLRDSSGKIAEINEWYLRRLGSDLHDGPAQLISLALLRIDALRRQDDSLAKEFFSDIDVIQKALHDAIEEIRHISSGLTLFGIDKMPIANVLKKVITSHELRTATKVNLSVKNLPTALPLAVKIAVFRFVQEALSNAYRHGGGVDQKVNFWGSKDDIQVEVSDGGPGFDESDRSKYAKGIGIIGLRERVRSLGGTLKVFTEKGNGARIVMHCPIWQRGKGLKQGELEEYANEN
jgi:signal transduction histidine kinase